MTTEQNIQFNKILKEKSEGKLYLHIFVTVMNSESAIFHHHYYVVRNGIVYSIGRKKPASMVVKAEDADNSLIETPSGDTLLDLNASCKCLGDYDESLVVFKDYPVVRMEHLEKKYLSKLKK